MVRAFGRWPQHTDDLCPLWVESRLGGTVALGERQGERLKQEGVTVYGRLTDDPFAPRSG